MVSNDEKLNKFIHDWQGEDDQRKIDFLHFKEMFEALESVILDFVPREGVTYSLRARHEAQTNKSLFAMIDVIEGEPRWLSVCFYAEMISDQEELGNVVPGGLLGEDGHCFDLEDDSEELVRYVEQRIKEAYENAAQKSS